MRQLPPLNNNNPELDSLTNSGIDQAIAFFNKPIEQKRRFNPTASTGYRPLGTENGYYSYRLGQSHDIPPYEYIHLNTASFRGRLNDSWQRLYYEVMDTAIEDFGSIHMGDLTLRIMHYPPLNNGNLGLLGKHVDMCYLTYSLGSRVVSYGGRHYEGTNYRTRFKGEQYALYHNDLKLSTIHSARAVQGADRYAIVAFATLGNDIPLHNGITAGEYLKEVLSHTRNYDC